MAKPPTIQKLRHGRLLCGTVFRFFVETWNWLTAYVDNMKGDLDVDPMNGVITVDRTQADFPVIRFRKDRLGALGLGGYSGPFNPVENEQKIVTGFKECYFQVGGKTYRIADVENFGGADCIVALKIPATADQSPSDAQLVTYAGLESGAFDDLTSAQDNVAYEIVPLFIIDENRRVSVDLRAIPTFQLEEMI